MLLEASEKFLILNAKKKNGGRLIFIVLAIKERARARSIVAPKKAESQDSSNPKSSFNNFVRSY